MRRGAKTSVVAIAMLLLALGVAACGGDDSDTTTTGTASQGKSGAASEDGAAKGKKGKSGSGKDDEKKGSGGGEGGSEEEASDFVPKQHDDSGGGSKQFRVKGGDNSVQEFGEEADADDFSAAARAVHNFLDARAEGRWAAACEYLAGDVAESLVKLAAQAKEVEERDCAEVLGKLTNPAAKSELLKEAKRADVGSLRVEGDRAFVIYRGLEDTILAIPVKMEDGEWKVASLAGTPLN